MKAKEIGNKYNIDAETFEKFVVSNKLEHEYKFLSLIIPDDKVEEYVARYRKRLESIKIKKEESARKTEEAKAAKEKAMREMLISSGFSFDGYVITKYSGYISGDDAVQIPRSGVFGGHNGSNLTDALVKIRRQALIELKEAAYNLGCNAVIGVDFDYITLEPETASMGGGTLYEPYVICVTANGNAVVIEKKE